MADRRVRRSTTQATRLLSRAALCAYLDGLPWHEVQARMARGHLPGPLWRVSVSDPNARWDRAAIDRALDGASGAPISLEAQEAELDRACGYS